MILVKYLFLCYMLYKSVCMYFIIVAGKYVMDYNPLVLLLYINMSVTLSLLCCLVFLCIWLSSVIIGWIRMFTSLLQFEIG
jgi:hypothetical protein